MTDYQYTYPEDLSWMDESFGREGPLRDLAKQVRRVNAWIGGGLYDVVEDWPNISCTGAAGWREVPGLQADLLPITEDQRMALHIGFGGDEDEALALRARGHRYTLTRNDGAS